MIAKTLGEIVREKRNAADISLRELARRIGITPPFLSDIELGRRNPSEEVLAKMAQELKVPLEDLKKFDNRESITDLKRMMEENPELSFAFRTAIKQVKQGNVTVADFTKNLNKVR